MTAAGADVARRMRVLHVASGDLWAGAEVQVHQLLRALAMHPAVEVRAALMNGGQLAERLAADGVQVDVLDEQRHGALRLAARLKQIVQQWRPSIVHTHRRKEHILGGLAAWPRIPCVATVHGRPEYADRRDLRSRLLRVMERSTLRGLHRCAVAVSTEMTEHVARLAARHAVIHNAVDVDAVRAAATSSSGEQLAGAAGGRLGFVGRLVAVKRVDRLIEALALLDSRAPGRWSLHVIGDGPLRSALEAQAAAAGLGAAIRFLGFRPNPLPLLAQLDWLLFASEHEGLPMTALEAMALRVPLVAPPLGGLVELIGEAGSGRIATSADPRDLAAAIEASAAERAGGATLPERYTIRRCVESYVNLYRGVAGNARETVVPA